MRSWWPVGVALLALLAGLFVVLSERAPRLAGTNNLPAAALAATVPAGATLCQAGEALPADTAAVQVVAVGGGGIAVSVRAGERELARGGLARRPDGRVAIPLAGGAVFAAARPVTVCLRNLGRGPLRLGGVPGANPATTIAGAPAGAAVGLEYLRAGRESWWALAGTVAHRFGVAKAGWIGPWTLWAALAVMVALGGVSLLLVGRGAAGASGRGARRLGLACAGVAVANAAVWSVLVPPFHVPDETVHAGYAQYLAEEGRPPQQVVTRRQVSSEQAATSAATRFEAVVGRDRARPPWSEADEAALPAPGSLPRDDGGGASVAANHPPTYYALQAVPYSLGRGGSFLDRLALMRLLSALLAGVTVLGVFAFLRELLPECSCAWTVGALGAGLQPTFAFVSSGVNNDALLFAVGAWLLAALARTLRRGLTPRRAAVVGGLVGLGLVSKFAFLGLVPAAALALLVAARNLAAPRAALRALGMAGVCAAVPVALFLALNALAWDRVLLGPDATAARPVVVTLAGQLSYLWQSYLPRLPFMQDMLADWPPRWMWLQPFVGRFGWLDYGFPAWVYSAAEWVFAALGVGAVVTLARARRRVAARAGELAVYVVALGALLFLVGYAGYGYRLATGYQFEQARYLLPLLALYGALLALAVLAVPQRWRPAAAGVVVVLAFGHDLFAQLITLARYYG